jgi:hypothetical protein
VDWSTVFNLLTLFRDYIDPKAGQDKQAVLRMYRKHGLDLSESRQLYALFQGFQLLSSAVSALFGVPFIHERPEDVSVSNQVFLEACGRMLSELRSQLPHLVAARITTWELFVDDGSWPVEQLAWSAIRPGIRRLDASPWPPGVTAPLVKSGIDNAMAAYSPLAFEYVRRTAMEQAISRQCVQQMGPLSLRLHAAIAAGRAVWPEVDL